MLQYGPLAVTCVLPVAVLVAPRLVHLLIGRTGLVAFCCMTLIAPTAAACTHEILSSVSVI